MHHQPAVVSVHNQAREPVSLAEYEAASPSGTIEAKHIAAQRNGSGEAFAEKDTVEGNVRRPREEPDADLALRVVQTAGDEIARGSQQIDLGAVRRLALDARDGSLPERLAQTGAQKRAALGMEAGATFWRLLGFLEGL